MNARRWVVCALALSAPGCAWNEGSGFATLKETQVSARVQPDQASALAEITTDLGYVVQLESAELYVDGVVLEQASEGGTGAHFDPANPPDGYSLCHSGHCHSEDGRLVDYEEIAEEAASTGETYTSVASIPVYSGLDLLAGGALRVRQVEPSAELPRAEVQRVTLHAGALRLRGSVQSGPGGETLPEALPLSVDLELGVPLRAAVHVDIDRDSPAHVRAVVELIVPRTLLDELDFVRLAEAGTVSLSDVESPLVDPVLETLAESELYFELR